MSTAYTTKLVITLLLVAILALTIGLADALAMNADPGVSNGSIPYCERYVPSAC